MARAPAVNVPRSSSRSTACRVSPRLHVEQVIASDPRSMKYCPAEPADAAGLILRLCSSDHAHVGLPRPAH